MVANAVPLAVNLFLVPLKIVFHFQIPPLPL